MINCPTCKNFLLEKRAEFQFEKTVIGRYFCHECNCVFEKQLTDFSEEKRVVNLKDFKKAQDEKQTLSD